MKKLTLNTIQKDLVENLLTKEEIVKATVTNKGLSLDCGIELQTSTGVLKVGTIIVISKDFNVSVITEPEPVSTGKSGCSNKVMNSVKFSNR